MVTGRESDEAVGAVAQHATVPSQSETREAVGAVVQHVQLYPLRVRRETRRWVRLFSMQLYPVRVR